jgi:hypothetical protein
MLPVVIPDERQQGRLERLATDGVRIQESILRQGKSNLQGELERIQREVNEAVEDLYGVKAHGPFTQF